MKKIMFAVIACLTLSAAVLSRPGVAQAASTAQFSTAALNGAQKANAKAQITSALAPGVVTRVSFGTGKTPPGFIGNGLQQAKATVIADGKKSIVTFVVSPSTPKTANITKE